MMSAVENLSAFGAPFEALLLVVAVTLAVFAVVPQLSRWRGWALFAATTLLLLGEGVLIWFHYRIYQLAEVMDPVTGGITGQRRGPLVGGEREALRLGALVAVLGLVMRRHREEMLPGVLLMTAALIAGAALLGRPFTQPIPGFFGQYFGYLQAMPAADRAPARRSPAWRAPGSSTTTPGTCGCTAPAVRRLRCFALSFVATTLMIDRRHSSYETTAYRWTRLGYLPLTFGMLWASRGRSRHGRVRRGGGAAR